MEIRCSSRRIARHDIGPDAMQYSILNLYGTNPTVLCCTPNPEKGKMVGIEDEVRSVLFEGLGDCMVAKVSRRPRLLNMQRNVGDSGGPGSDVCSHVRVHVTASKE